MVKIRHSNLHPKLALYLKKMDLIPQPDTVPSFEEIRAEIEKKAIELCDHKVVIEHIYDLEIQASTTKLPIRVYQPEEEGTFPILVYVHGGEWVFGSINSHDNLCRYLAKYANCIVVSIGYRLSPEFKYPIALNDVYESILWIKSHANDYNGIPSKIGIAGDSAGGNLVAVLSHMIRDRHGPKITFSILINPVLDLNSFDSGSYRENNSLYGLTKTEMEWFKYHYLNRFDDTQSPQISPIYNQNLKNLPPTMIFVSEFDILRDEGIRYAALLQKAGCQVSLVVGNGLIHGGVFWAVASSIYIEPLNETVKFIKSYFY